MSQIPSHPKSAVVLVNLGTPASTKTRDVRRYLREFLSDPYVIDIPAVGRWFLLNFAILPFRPRRSAALYRKIWTERGSPLLVNSRDLEAKVGSMLGRGTLVRLGMRYGKPSFSEVVGELKALGVERVAVMPLYPQYALSSTETARAHWARACRDANWAPDTRWLGAFAADPDFISALARSFRESVSAEGFDHVLMSFHGLPERHVLKTDATGEHCLKTAGCCDILVEANKNCYRAHCFATARGLAQTLGLRPAQYTVAFQSRLGRTPWIRPFSDEVVKDLGRQGIKKLVTIAPSFTADCLETLEELQLGLAKSFVEAGGKEMQYVPCLNARDDWASWISKRALELLA